MPTVATNVFSDDWERREDGWARLEVVFGYEIVPLDYGNGLGGVAVLLKVATSKEHRAAIDAGTEKPKLVQLAFNADYVRGFAAAVAEAGAIVMKDG